MKTSLAINVRLANEIGRSVGNALCLGRIVDEGRENIRKIDLSSRTKGRDDARSSAPHAILDLLHGVIVECPERTARITAVCEMTL
jgi:hypothetical protein